MHYLSLFEGLWLTVTEYSWFSICIQLCRALDWVLCVGIYNLYTIGKHFWDYSKKRRMFCSFHITIQFIVLWSFRYFISLKYTHLRLDTDQFSNRLRGSSNSEVPIRLLLQKSCRFSRSYATLYSARPKEWDAWKELDMDGWIILELRLKMSVVCMCIRFTQFRSSLEADCCGQVMKSEHLFTGWLTFDFLRVLVCGIRNPYYI